MDDTLIIEATADEAKELEAAINQIFEAVEQADARIRSDQAEIEKLKAETRAMLNELKAAA
jgi:uncharacterized protein YaaN involved in tellurite resistance